MENSRKDDSLVAKLKQNGVAIAAALTFGCGGNACDGPNHLVVQYDGSGVPLNCWKIVEENLWTDDGFIYWGHQRRNATYVSPPAVSMPVQNGQWEAAAQALGIDLSRCTNGRYRSE